MKPLPKIPLDLMMKLVMLMMALMKIMLEVKMKHHVSGDPVITTHIEDKSVTTRPNALNMIIGVTA
jgi:hypothetical protein